MVVSEKAYQTAVRVQEAIDAARTIHGTNWPRLRSEIRRRLSIRAAIAKRPMQEVAIESAKDASGVEALVIIAAVFDRKAT